MRFDWWTFGIQMVNFAVLVWLLRRFLHKPALRMIDAPAPFIGDGAYDRSRVLAAVHAKNPDSSSAMQRRHVRTNGNDRSTRAGFVYSFDK